MTAVGAEMAALLARPPVERWRDGVRVTLAGPPNAGKSSLFNALAGRDAAIVTPLPGTTRDVIEAAVTRAGIPFTLVDTAGLRTGADAIERQGIARAGDEIARADIVLWLGEPRDCPDDAILIHSRSDEPGRDATPPAALATAIAEPFSVERLWDAVAARAATMLPDPAHAALGRDQRAAVATARLAIEQAAGYDDAILIAEELRVAHVALARLLGHDVTERVLNRLFERFCIGK